MTDTVLPRIRTSPLLTDLATRVFTPGVGAGQVPVVLQPDRHVAGPDVLRLPVVGVLGLGLTPVQAAQLVDHVAELQEECLSFRPVLVLDRPVFNEARAHGYVLEHVVPSDTWAAGGWTADGVPAPGSWESYLARRVSSVTDRYRLWYMARAVPVSSHADVTLDPVDIAVLRHLPERFPEGLQVHRGS
ncbi:hypothetical protein [Ornithinimicrobium kibberense]|uniref:Uncharacterized protein n=1 Tax=Ornithinimicrobium kibberense TaxID=282060 RepID=A0ABV5V1D2_9MICO|nr:hypothetical protein [Ornithinimicrobium kibberense]